MQTNKYFLYQYWLISTIFYPKNNISILILNNYGDHFDKNTFFGNLGVICEINVQFGPFLEKTEIFSKVFFKKSPNHTFISQITPRFPFKNEYLAYLLYF